MANLCQIPLLCILAHALDVNERYVSYRGTQCSENKPEHHKFWQWTIFKPTLVPMNGLIILLYQFENNPSRNAAQDVPDISHPKDLIQFFL